MSYNLEFKKAIDMDLFADSKKVCEYLCSLCTGVYFNPVVDECGHVFCRECIRAWFKQTGGVKVCPITKQAYPSNEEKDIIRNLILIQEILERLDVKCKNNCGWKGVLREMMSHIEKDCKNTTVKCAYEGEGCLKEFMRSDKEVHEQACEFKAVPCSKCEESVPLNQMIAHYETCPKVNIKCPQNCDCEVQRCQVENHIKDVCENTEVECSYFKLGCEIRARRKEVVDHNNDHKLQHEKLLINYLIDLNDKVGALASKFDNHRNEDQSKKMSKNIASYIDQTLKNKNSVLDDYSKGKKGGKKQKSQSDFSSLPAILEKGSSNNSNNQNNNNNIFVSKKRERAFKSNNNIISAENIEDLDKSKNYYRDDEEKSDIPINREDDNSPIQIDASFISKGVSVSENSAVNNSTAKNDHKFIFANLNLNSRNAVWKVTINKKTSWMAFGCSLKEKVISNNYKFIGINKEHGCFMLSPNGFSWNANSDEENNVKASKDNQVFPQIQDGDVISFDYRHAESELTISFKGFTCTLHSVFSTKAMYLVPTVILFSYQDEITFTK